MAFPRLFVRFMLRKVQSATESLEVLLLADKSEGVCSLHEDERERDLSPLLTLNK